MTDMLRIAEEAAAQATEQAKFSLVSIDLNTIVFTLINTLIIVLLYFFFLHKPVCKILDERAKTVNKDMDDAQKAKEEAAAVKADYEQDFQYDPAGQWLDKNCYKYGFIIRYPKGKESSTGYMYEPWHVRYIGVDLATKVTQSGLSLEEYFGITSQYQD